MEVTDALLAAVILEIFGYYLRDSSKSGLMQEARVEHEAISKLTKLT